MTPANDNRPAGFDAALEAYLPSLRKQANFLAGNSADGEVLLHETVVRMLRCADNCRIETFKTWAQLRLNSTAQELRNYDRRAARRAPVVSIDAATGGELENLHAALHCVSSQHAHLELKEVVGKLRRIPNGDIVLRRAAGVSLSEIGAENGTSKENIRQKEERARSVLCQRMGRRAA